jgi:nitrite reductase/ring-hydroxylating ferredoxin subunit
LFFKAIKIDKMVQFSRKVIKAFLVLIFISIGINGCKDNYITSVPYVPVSFTVNPTNIIELNIPGGSFFFPNVGYGGIIIFHDFVESSNPYLAFDATCTFEMLQDVQVVSDGSGTATCPVCKSQYILFGGDGSATSGPSAEPLKQYHTYYSGGLIVIKN